MRARGARCGLVASAPVSLHTVLPLSPVLWWLIVLLVVVSLCMFVLWGFRSVEGGDELVEHGLMHGGLELASGRVEVASIGCNSCMHGI